MMTGTQRKNLRLKNKSQMLKIAFKIQIRQKTPKLVNQWAKANGKTNTRTILRIVYNRSLIKKHTRPWKISFRVQMSRCLFRLNAKLLTSILNPKRVACSRYPKVRTLVPKGLIRDSRVITESNLSATRATLDKQAKHLIRMTRNKIKSSKTSSSLLHFSTTKPWINWALNREPHSTWMKTMTTVWNSLWLFMNNKMTMVNKTP